MSELTELSAKFAVPFGANPFVVRLEAEPLLAFFAVNLQWTAPNASEIPIYSLQGAHRQRERERERERGREGERGRVST